MLSRGMAVTVPIQLALNCDGDGDVDGACSFLLNTGGGALWFLAGGAFVGNAKAAMCV